MSFNSSKTGLQAPLKPPTAPTNVRLYATQQKTVDGARAIISLFWSPPTEWNATPFQYIVNCTKVDFFTLRSFNNEENETIRGETFTQK
ncbi:hypothetical protein ANCCAN_27617 [Ancylostoma caninum]|uniref:Uncharacterized protein n=1 Tax=Ancylostoma caninum TaxID=29170 RepID=A0A368F3I7_ANCCA|nr:hypothetical protein ANCCAN_27617 [Ancylostoma caninum]